MEREQIIHFTISIKIGLLWERNYASDIRKELIGVSHRCFSPCLTKSGETWKGIFMRVSFLLIPHHFSQSKQVTAFLLSVFIISHQITKTKWAIRDEKQ